MKTRIIRINSIDEIDTSRISVYDLNNRYIDPKGDMYGLKYNIADKRIEIIKLMRAHAKDAAAVSQQIIRKKHDVLQREAQSEPAPPAAVRAETASQPAAKRPVAAGGDPVSIINAGMELLIVHKNRLNGIIMNLKNSHFIKDEDKTDNIGLDDYFRTISIDAIQKIDKLETYQKELQNYPRSSTYYQSKIDKDGLAIMETLSGDQERLMKFIYRYEMFNGMRGILRQERKLLNDLLRFLSGISGEMMKHLERFEKQNYEDALTSLKNTITECDLCLDDLAPLEKAVFDPESY